MLVQHAKAVQLERIVPRGKGDGLAVTEFIVQVAAKIKIFGLVRCSSAHTNKPSGRIVNDVFNVIIPRRSAAIEKIL